MNKEFFISLRGRGLNQTKLAQLAQCGRSHLSQVLSGRRNGSQTKRKLRAHLTEQEVKMLGWNCEQ